MYSKWDKVEYVGALPHYKDKLWTVVDIDTDANYVDLVTASADNEIVNTMRVPEVAIKNKPFLKLKYSDVPRFQFNDSVWHFFDNRYIKGVVQSLIPSYTKNQHSYVVLFETGETYTIQQDLLAQFEEDKLLDSTQTTINHINVVRENLARFVVQLIQRGEIHDDTKLRDPEKTLLDAMEYVNVNEGNAPYGSPEYIKRTAILKPMLKHHYAAWRHHPEFHPNGVNSMNLVDIVEVISDWQAASQRNKEPEMNITAACERYGINEQLKQIFINTAEMMGWKWK